MNRTIRETKTRQNVDLEFGPGPGPFNVPDREPRFQVGDRVFYCGGLVQGTITKISWISFIDKHFRSHNYYSCYVEAPRLAAFVNDNDLELTANNPRLDKD